MIVQIKSLLPKEVVTQFRRTLDIARWDGAQPVKLKGNYQLPESDEQLPQLRRTVMEHLQRNALFFSATLPRRLFPPSFTRFGGAVATLGGYTDNSVRMIPGTMEHVRTDICCTIFLSDPKEYDGGELVIEDAHLSQRVKLPAGDAIIYPATRLHRVESVTRGARTACSFWVESMVRDDVQRQILFDMDIAILSLRQTVGETEAVHSLTSSYHNLLRLWAVT